MNANGSVPGYTYLWVLGDAHATRYGAEPVGLPAGAGYAAGNRLVDAYRARTGRTTSECLLVAAADVIAVTAGDA